MGLPIASTCTTSPEIHIGSESISPAYHKHPFRHSATSDLAMEMDSRKMGTESVSPSECNSGTESTTPRDLESSGLDLHHEEDGEEQAVGLVPSLNK